ncbi:MAG: FAD:protein FMN transferase [Rhizobiaceae bacterium]|jgi:thiamine biosynthesis lipoprotein|nr:FAD:protein FMN transferase [Rhizobiaceae bacterium]
MNVLSLSRRRFMQVSACAAGAAVLPGAARASSWHGRAFGADVSLTFEGSEPDRAIDGVLAIVDAYEKAFSLHDPESEISRINRDLVLAKPSALFGRMMRDCTRAWLHTGRYFDPTVQALWQIARDGGVASLQQPRVGWLAVQWTGAGIELMPGASITLNGVAQGAAADEVKTLLKGQGFDRCLIDMGELATIGDGWRVGVETPEFGQLARLTLNGTAVSTSSPNATLVNGVPHIMSPFGGAPQWSTVTVEAKTAFWADVFSTALCLVRSADMREIIGRGGKNLVRVLAVDARGDLQTLK